MSIMHNNIHKCIYCGKSDGMLMLINAPGTYFQHFDINTGKMCIENTDKILPNGEKENEYNSR